MTVEVAEAYEKGESIVMARYQWLRRRQIYVLRRKESRINQSVARCYNVELPMSEQSA